MWMIELTMNTTTAETSIGIHKLIALTRILHELPELSPDFTSAAWLIVCRNIAMLWFKRDQPGCAVQSGDKPAAVHFVFLRNPE
jgi:hypothetical protein